MRITHMVDIRTFHQHYLFFHHLTGDGMSYCRIGFMTVYPFQLDSFSIDIVVTSCKPEFIRRCRRILDFHLTESHNSRNRLNRLVLLVLQLGYQRIAIRKLCRPFIRSFYVKNRLNPARFVRFNFFYHRRQDTIHQRILVRVELVGIQRIIHFIILGRFLIQITNIGIDSQRTVRISRIQIGSSHQVAEVNFRHRIQSYRTEDARQTEHILRFQKGAVRAAIYFGSHHVLAFLQIRGDIKISGIA